MYHNVSALNGSLEVPVSFHWQAGGEDTSLFPWNCRCLKEIGWKPSSPPWNGPFFGNHMPAYRGNARAVNSSLPHLHGSLGEGTNGDRWSLFLSCHSPWPSSDPCYFHGCQLVPVMLFGALWWQKVGLIPFLPFWGSENILWLASATFLRVMWIMIPLLFCIEEGAVRCKPLERVSKPMAQYWSQAGVGASFWNGAPPASSFSVVFLFKLFLNVSVLVIPAQKRILICNVWYKSCKHT